VKISLDSAGKKYLREWIFRKTNLSFSPGQSVVVLGPNGSGKSTLLQVIAGAILLNEGTIKYHVVEKEIPNDDIFSHVSFVSPYLELIEEFTLREILNFHFKFKKPLGNISVKEILEITGLGNKSSLSIRNFSSGMKQRLKLSLAILSESSLLILDEPCSNLDQDGVEWYQRMIKTYSGTGRL
jgi:ABC-type multidrug transport system ATPase subunit